MLHTWHILTQRAAAILETSRGGKMNQVVQVKGLPGPAELLGLPLDVLWTILSFLDVFSLCTARLVCKDFWRSASGHLKALRLPSTALEQPPTSTFRQLSGLVYVKVSVASEEQFHMLAHPQIAPVITHVDLKLCPLPESLDQLSLLPNLCEVFLHGEVQEINLRSMLPCGLEKLHVEAPIRKWASWLNSFTGLKSLTIHLEAGAGRCLGRLTRLRNLRFLGLQCGVSALRVLSTLTMLTALEWDVVTFRGSRPHLSMHSLASLTGLSHLVVHDRWRTLMHERLAPLSQLTGLTHLDITHTPLAECAMGSSFLVPLTSLVSLGLNCSTVRMSLLPSLNVEALQSLTLRCAPGDVSVLQRATGLTQLCIIKLGPEMPQGLEPSIASMTRLRSLWLELGDKYRAPVPFRLSLVLRSLTSLKQLNYSGKFTVGSDLRAIAALPSLRSLGLAWVPEVFPTSLPALQAMSGLTELSLLNTGIRPEHVTPEVREAFDVERLHQGWPRLALSINSVDV